MNISKLMKPEGMEILGLPILCLCKTNNAVLDIRHNEQRFDPTSKHQVPVLIFLSSNRVDSERESV
jgi:hypothetical protein